MKNLKNLDKKSVFKITINIVIISLILFICYELASINIKHVEDEKQKIEQYNINQENLLTSYKVKLDSIAKINLRLEEEQLKISKKIDSITKSQKKIGLLYDKEISNINNGNINDHVQWLLSKIDSLKNSEIRNNK